MNWYQRGLNIVIAFIVCRLTVLFPDVMATVFFTLVVFGLLLEWLAQREKGNL